MDQEIRFRPLSFRKDTLTQDFHAGRSTIGDPSAGGYAGARGVGKQGSPQPPGTAGGTTHYFPVFVRHSSPMNVIRLIMIRKFPIGKILRSSKSQIY